MDKRAEILKAELLKVGEPDIQTSTQAIYNAMDENGKQMCLDILEWMAKNKVIGSNFRNGNPLFFYKGKWISKEQLFENFL